MARKKRGGFRSKKQWRMAFARGFSWAHGKAHKTAGGKGTRYRRLPMRKKG
jgi:hypothetical protein